MHMKTVTRNTAKSSTKTTIPRGDRKYTFVFPNTWRVSALYAIVQDENGDWRRCEVRVDKLNRVYKRLG